MQPAYRMRVYAPRSEDATEATVMQSLASHPSGAGVNFQVASITGVTGYEPYMNPPTGRRGTLDSIDGRGDIGELTVTLVDKQVSGNLSRWVTGFVGTATGRDRLKNCKVVIEERLDTGGSWLAHYTGRIHRISQDERALVTLQIRDFAEDLKMRVFTGRPHSSVRTTANYPTVMPIGLPIDYAGVTKTGGLPAQTAAGNPAQLVMTEGGISRDDAVITTWLRRGQKGSHLGEMGFTEKDNLRVTYVDGVTTGEFDISHFSVVQRDARHAPSVMYVTELDASDPDYLAFPVAQQTPDVALQYLGPPTEETPLFIADRHPATMVRELLDGKFSTLDSAGAVTRTIAHTGLATFEADATWPTVRFQIREEAELFEWLVENIMRPLGMGFRFNNNGDFELLDLRLTNGQTVATTITNAEIDPETQPRRVATVERAVPRIVGTWYTDVRVNLRELLRAADEADEAFPSLPISRWMEVENNFVQGDDPDAVINQLDVEPTQLIARGLRGRHLEGDNNAMRSLRARQQLSGRVSEIQAQLSRGADLLSMACRRVAAVEALNIGDWIVVDVDEIIDPATNLRGGPRLARIEELTENGVTRELFALDAGINAQAADPTMADPVQDASGDPFTRASVQLTRNSDGDGIIVHVAITDTSVTTRPAETSALWYPSGAIGRGAGSSSQTILVGNLPAGARVWMRARSLPTSLESLRLVSDWVFPTTAPPTGGFVDMAAFSAPTGLGASVSGLRVTLSWTNTETDFPLFLYVIEGTGSSPDAEANIVTRLPKKSTGFLVTNGADGQPLALNTAHRWGVRYVGPNGGKGAFADSNPTNNFTTAVSANAAPSMAGAPVILVHD